MRIHLDPSIARRILGDFHILPRESIEPNLLRMVRDYKEKVAARFTSINAGDVPRLPGSRFYVSRKMDGEHSILYYERGNACLIRPSGAVYIGLPVIDTAAEILKRAGVRTALIPGELIVLREDGNRTRIFDVIRLTSRPETAKDLEQLWFAPFDIIELDGEYFDDYDQVYERLQTLFAGTPVPPVETIVSEDRGDILQYYERQVREFGAEGVMIRSDLPFRYKFKAEHRVDAVIVGYKAFTDARGQGRVASVLTALMREDGTFQILTRVSDGFSDDERRELYDRLRKLEINSGYVHVDSQQSAYHMVEPRIVIEFNSDDILTKRSGGRPYLRMLLEYEHETYKTYRVVRNVPFVSMQRNTFIRMREDKSAVYPDVRITQITDLVFIDGFQPTVPRIEYPPSQILLRLVYSRGRQAVRKFVVWQTNKDEVDPDYPAYVFSYTDYSAHRKEPLQQDVRISSDLDQIIAIAEEFQRKYVKKDWLLRSKFEDPSLRKMMPQSMIGKVVRKRNAKKRAAK